MPSEPPTRDELMRACIEQAALSASGDGGPFGALIVRKEQVVATGTNGVTSLRDPTAHAEVQAIRAACRALDTWDLAGCDLYTSCEPCPMCLGAAYWARVRHVFFCATRADAAAAGFDDARIYDELALPFEGRTLPLVRILPDHAARPFEAWVKNKGRIAY
jgi:tRNA(Arg) A34 adenosine deaminase TadA